MHIAGVANCFYAYSLRQGSDNGQNCQELQVHLISWSALSSTDCISWGQCGFFGPSTHGICQNGNIPHLCLSMANKRQTPLYLRFGTGRDPVLSRQACGSGCGVHVLYWWRDTNSHKTRWNVLNGPRRCMLGNTWVGRWKRGLFWRRRSGEKSGEVSRNRYYLSFSHRTRGILVEREMRGFGGSQGPPAQGDSTSLAMEECHGRGGWTGRLGSL